MNRSYVEKYLRLSGVSHLHMTPRGGVVYHNTPNVASGSATKLIPINRTARELLLLCSGEKTTREILKSLVSQVGSPERGRLASSSLVFLDEALRREMVKTSASPNHVRIATTGNRDFWAPVHVAVELTSNCNLNCQFCYRDAGHRHQEELPYTKLIEILKKLYHSGVRAVELTGGEPMTHPHFFDILDFCASYFRIVALLTNGCLIDQKGATILGSYGEVLYVQVDLDGSTAEVHDRIKGRVGAFEKTKHAIEHLSKNHVRTRVVMNVTSDNSHDIEDTLKLANKLGATWFGYSPVLPVGRAKTLGNTLTPEQIARVMGPLLQNLASKYPSFLMQMTQTQFERIWHSKNCGVGYRTFVLGPTGIARPCPMLPEHYLCIGDLGSWSVEGVFRNPLVSYLAELRAPHPEICGDCRYMTFCFNCIARAILAQEEMGSPCRWAVRNHLEDWFDPRRFSGAATRKCHAGSRQEFSIGQYPISAGPSRLAPGGSTAQSSPTKHSKGC